MRVQTKVALFGIVGSIGLGCASALAGSAFFDFNRDPFQDLQIIGSGSWQPDGGVTGQAGDGYLVVTDALGSQRTKIIFDDFDNGMVVKAFDFSCDLRIGSGTTDRPADGFSINYARTGDPALDPGRGTDGWAGSVNEPPNAPGLPEEGTITGLAIGFDTWTSGLLVPGGTIDDVEGISIRVDETIIFQKSFPTRNGACDDLTSLQTGPLDTNNPGSPDGLCWQPFTASVKEDATVTITWKGTDVVRDLATTYFPSQGRLVFGGRTGGANENHHMDNLRIVTYPADKIVIGTASGHPYGFNITIDDSGASVLDPASVALTFDGTAVTATPNKVGTMTTFQYRNPASPLASGSAHTLNIAARDTQGRSVTADRNFNIPAYATVPAAYKLAATPTGNGFSVMVRQQAVPRAVFSWATDANLIVNAENGLFGGDLDPATGQPFENTADMTFADANGLFTADVVNWEQDGADVGGEFFGSTVPVGAEQPNALIPGIPGFNPDNLNDNIVAAAFGYVQLQAGQVYTWGVASDDGFTVSVGPGAQDPLGVRLGSFNGGRGVAGTSFDFIALENGFYPVRMSWWEGGGGANCEFYSVASDGTKTLINGSAAGAVRVYKTGQGKAQIKSFAPYPGYRGVFPNQAFKIVLADGTTTVDTATVELGIDGQAVQAQVSKVAGVTTVTYQPAAPFATGSTHNNNWFSYRETGAATARRIDFSFQVRALDVIDMPPAPPSFVIEAEDFDFDGGQMVATADTMPYDGGAYDGLGAVHNTDYYQDYNEPASDLYRQGESPNVPMDPQTTAGTLDVRRPGYTATSNYKIGWAGGGEWYHYTRTIPAGLYTAYGAHSTDPSGTVGGRLGLFANGSVTDFGPLSGIAPGGWGNNGLVPLQAADGSQGVFRLPGGRVTLRYTTSGGDFDWFVLAPVSNVKPKIVSGPGPDSMRRNQVVLDWVFQDYSTTIVDNSVKVFVNDVEVQAQVSKAGDLTSIHYAPAGMMERGDYSWKVTFRESGGTDMTSQGTFRVNPYPAEGIFAIEAEDFNFNSGQIMPAANTMPYTGGAYDGLSAVLGVDYNSTNGNESDVYRIGESPNKNVSEALGGRWGQDRGVWDMTANYRLGWAGDSEWFNYTRNIPAGTYEVWAALSYDGRGANNCRGSLAKVTSSPTAGNQTTETLGIFRAAATGGWGANDLFPMVESAGGPAKTIVLAGGDITFRFTDNSGDFDYFFLLPVGGAPEPPKFTSWVKNADGTITVTWTGGGTLQGAPAVTGPWQDVAGATSPFTLPASGQMMFGRIKR